MSNACYEHIRSLIVINWQLLFLKVHIIVHVTVPSRTLKRQLISISNNIYLGIDPVYITNGVMDA